MAVVRRCSFADAAAARLRVDPRGGSESSRCVAQGATGSACRPIPHVEAWIRPQGRIHVHTCSPAMLAPSTHRETRCAPSSLRSDSRGESVHEARLAARGRRRCAPARLQAGCPLPGAEQSSGLFCVRAKSRASRYIAAARAHPQPCKNRRWRATTWHATARGAGRWWYPRAQGRFRVRWTVRTRRAGLMRKRWSVLGGRPGAWTGERGCRRRPAAAASNRRSPNDRSAPRGVNRFT